MDPAIVALITAALTTFVAAGTALLVARRQHELQLIREMDAASIARLGAFLGATHAVSLAVSKLARASESDKADVEAEADETADRMNTALAAVRVAEPNLVVSAARALDRYLIELLDDARSSQWEREAWRQRRAATETLVDDVIVASRDSVEARKRK
ncbi:hypothetical protein E4P39_19855 [Blastococcus sp. CT_GayMR19]|uniref:hypothetical protein n=1 Tax=Blastococcus sp. CT_GayMR19 TaxID=2559608 RepID=UPI0010730ADB|nr:hypothetical protein [Blastococcus sp. CT_GayMR19]TFV70541.1 hypothetical protein E4P39_19855 [Blastococcus sp. CT_GayMR19]